MLLTCHLLGSQVWSDCFLGKFLGELSQVRHGVVALLPFPMAPMGEWELCEL